MRKNHTKNQTMKQLLAIAAIVTFVFSACQPQDELAQVTKELKEKRTELTTLKAAIKELEEKKELLDTSNNEVEKSIVYLSPIIEQEFESFVEVHGVVESDKNIVVMPEMSGLATSIQVKDGSSVRKGQVLGRVDTEIVRNNIAEVEKRLELAIQVFEKQKNLRENNVGTEIQFLEAKNNKEALEQSIKTLKAQMSKSTIVSPIDGKIDEVYPRVGEMVSPAQPFARIINTKDVYINADVSEAFFNKVKVGKVVRVRFPYQKDTIRIPIEYVGNYINPNNRTFKVHANLDKAGKSLPPNLLAVMQLQDVYEEKAIVVPTNAIQNDGKHDYVMVVVKGKSEKRIVKTGSTYQNQTVINEGLKVGEQLVYKGYRGLTPGTEVQIKK